MKLEDTFLKHFSDIDDPRLSSHRNFRHRLEDLLIIAILGTICGADGWVEIHRFGLAKQEWLDTFLELPNGIPSHDTFGRVFSQLDPKTFEQCFMEWLGSLHVDVNKEIIALDGKTLRGSGNKRAKKSPLHIVSAWATQHRLLLGQVKTQNHSNEIKAIPTLLNMIDIQGSTITIDAIGCQTNIAKQIRSQGANYVIALKANQPTLHNSVKSIFDLAEEGEKKYKKMLHRRKVEKLHDHGRVETRRYTLLSARDDNITFSLQFPGLTSVGKVDITRTTHHEVEHSTRYFLSSFHYEDIDDFMQAVRQHWQIEINLHWSLDVSFREDHSQIHVGHAAENLALIRRIALNLLKQESTHKNGISCRRKTAGWDNKYLLKVLSADSALNKKQSGSVKNETVG